jgi:hypothetical protein
MYTISNYMGESTPFKTTICSTNQEVPRVLWNPKAQCLQELASGPLQ